MISLEMRKLVLIAAIGVIAAVGAAACGDDDDDGATIAPTGPATVSIEKAFALGESGDFTFTVQISNNSENSAVQVILSDAWANGLELTSLGDLDGVAADMFPDNAGFEVLLDELKAGEAKDIVYKAECTESGQWTNVATVSWENAEPADANSDTTSVSISCP